MGRPPKYDWDSARSLALNGIPLVEVSEKLSIDYNTLRNRAFREAAAHLELLPEEELIESHQALANISKAAATSFGWNRPEWGQANRCYDVRMTMLSPRQRAIVAETLPEATAPEADPEGRSPISP